MAEQTVQVSPMAVAKEATILNEFYRNRVLLLANEVEQLRGRVADLEQELADTCEPSGQSEALEDGANG